MANGPTTDYSVALSEVTDTPFSREKRMMRPILVSISLIGFVSMLSGCQSMREGKADLRVINGPSVSGDSCLNADWFEVGRVDGLSGIPLNTSGYVGRCLSRGVPVNNELYYAGWQRGLIDYCTPERGFDAGRNGESYADVCPKNVEPAFLKRFKIGTGIAQIERKNALLELEVDRKLSELEALNGPSAESILGDALSRLPGSTTPSGTSVRNVRQSTIRSEIGKLRDDLARNQNAIRELETSASL